MGSQPKEKLFPPITAKPWVILYKLFHTVTFEIVSYSSLFQKETKNLVVGRERSS